MENRAEGIAEMEMRAIQHDMRAPIANVIALTQMTMRMLTGGTEESSVMPYLRSILVAAQELEQLTGDLARKGTAHKERFSAQDVAEMIRAAIGAQAEKKSQHLCVDISGLGGVMLLGERTALMRILMNLMGNAVKYTQTGGTICLTGKMISREGDRVLAQFTIADDGMGMKPEFMRRMYEPLARAKEAIDEDIPGSGLGLSIVRRLTQHLGGTIDVSSEWGKGTAFTLTVPLELGQEAGDALRGKRFLLAEDNDLSAEIACALLNGQGASVCRVKDGREAEERFLSSPAGAFDAILMDMHMPQMDGCTAARAIRVAERTDVRRIPILALTAGGDAQDVADALASGMNACLRKPLDVDALAAAMEDAYARGLSKSVGL